MQIFNVIISIPIFDVFILISSKNVNFFEFEEIQILRP